MSDESMVVVGEDYFQDASDNMVEYLTDQGVNTIKRFEESFNSVRSRSQTLASILVSGIGGASMLFVSTWSGKENMIISAALAIIAVGWFLCLWSIIDNVLTTRGRPIAFASPLVLYDADNVLPLSVLKRKKLYSYSQSYEDLDKITMEVSRHFNLAMKASAGIPVASMIICLFLKFLMA